MEYEAKVYGTGTNSRIWTKVQGANMDRISIVGSKGVNTYSLQMIDIPNIRLIPKKKKKLTYFRWSVAI